LQKLMRQNCLQKCWINSAVDWIWMWAVPLKNEFGAFICHRTHLVEENSVCLLITILAQINLQT